MYKQQKLTTERMTTAYYRAGEGREKKLLLVHGNVSSSDFYLPLFPALSENFDVVAIDLRCFGDSDALPIDATRAFGDWVDDLAAFVKALGWDKFAMAGWSLGGCITMQYALEHGEQLTGMILINPGSPYGYGGTKDVNGTMLEPAGLASGAGCTTQKLLEAMKAGERDFLRTTLKNVYFKPTYDIDPVWEERFLDSMLKTKVGEGMYPGDYSPAEQWPFVTAGNTGVSNTMSPIHCNLSGLADAPTKPPVLWVRSLSDVMVSDTAICDFGYLGQLGLVPGWPGADVLPPQPMVSQTRQVLDRMVANGGSYREVILEGGHGCHLESPDEFVAAVCDFLA